MNGIEKITARIEAEAVAEEEQPGGGGGEGERLGLGARGGELHARRGARLPVAAVGGDVDGEDGVGA